MQLKAFSSRFRGIVLLSGLFVGCRSHQSISEQELFPAWNGFELQFNRVDSNPKQLELKAEGFPDLQTLPFRLMAIDSSASVSALKLLEFGSEIESYAAFQSFSEAEELEAGFARRADFVFFRKGRWMGLIAAPLDSGLSWISAHLKIPGNSEWGAIPQVFSSMLHQGRIRATERVLTKLFLGIPISTPVFTVEIDCWGDSAMIFASSELPDGLEKNALALDLKMEKVGRNMIFTRDSGNYGPIRIEAGSNGMVGVEGCFDSSLTGRWLKNQKTALNSLKST